MKKRKHKVEVDNIILDNSKLLFYNKLSNSSIYNWYIDMEPSNKRDLKKLSPEDSLFLINSILSSNEPNDKLKALFSKDSNEILKELLAQKK